MYACVWQMERPINIKEKDLLLWSFQVEGHTFRLINRDKRCGISTGRNKGITQVLQPTLACPLPLIHSLPFPLPIPLLFIHPLPSIHLPSPPSPSHPPPSPLLILTPSPPHAAPSLPLTTNSSGVVAGLGRGGGSTLEYNIINNAF